MVRARLRRTKDPITQSRVKREATAAPVISVSPKWIVSRGKRVAKADEVIRDPDLVVGGLYGELMSIADELRVRHERNRVSGMVGDIIIQADREVEFELLAPVLYTSARAGYKKWHLAAINPQSRQLEVVALESPRVGGPWLPPAAALPKPEPFLFAGDDSFRLRYRNVWGAIEKDYFVLAAKLKHIKRRYPEQKRLTIMCDRRVKYGELVHIIEVSIQPGIGLTEIYLGQLIEGLGK